jgi:serine/threonine protein phosphatase 1
MLFRRAKPAPAAPIPRSLPEGVRVYAIGDVHGRLDCLTELLGLIETDLAATTSAARETVLVFLGDYVDRGPDSAPVLERLTKPLRLPAKTRFLKGNHEDGMLQFLDDPLRARAWINWGRETFLSYGIDVAEGEAAADPARIVELHEALTRAVPPHHRKFLDDLSVSTQIGDYFFAHAGVDPDLPLGMQPDRALLWIRDKFLASEKEYGRLIVHGHSVAETPVELPNRLGIDTGAYRTGVLTALVLEGTARRFLQTSAGEA